jgi:pyroglutamyl-peptidase
MKILIYSFEKFDRLQSNPASIVGEKLTEIIKERCESKFIKLQTTFDCWKNLEKEIKEFSPDFILGLGVAPNRHRICIENIAINIIHSPKPDNNGKIIENEKITKKGSLAYETTIDSRELFEHLKDKNIPVELSFFADTYVCNFAYYHCLNYCRDKKIKNIFLHIPLSPQEVNNLNANLSSFPLDNIIEALRDYINEIILKNDTKETDQIL